MYESLCMHASHFRLQQLNKSTVRKEKHGGISSQAWCKQSNRWYQESKNDNGIKTYWCVQFSESVSICGALTMSLTSLIFPLLPHTSSSFLSSFLFLLWQIKFTQAVHHSPSPHAIHFFSFFFYNLQIWKPSLITQGQHWHPTECREALEKSLKLIHHWRLSQRGWCDELYE